MAVTDEQRALLQLLLEGGQSYDDIGSLLGIGPEEVRSRARSALTDIGGADPDAQVGLSDYLLGQADPIGRADAVRHLQSDPDANALAERLVQNLRLLAPKAQLPEIPPAKGGRRPTPVPPPAATAPGGTAASPPAPPASPTQPSTPAKPGIASRAAGAFSGLGKLEGKRRTQAIVGAAAALAIVIVLLVVVTGGGSSSEESCKPLDTSAVEQAGVPAVPLKPVGEAAQEDCKPTGQIALIPIPNQQKRQKGQKTQGGLAGFAFQTNAANVPSTSDGDTYVVWFVGSGDQARPLGKIGVSADGGLNGTATLSTAATAVYLQALPTIRISRVTEAQAQQVQQALASNAKSKQPTGVVQFVGVPVLEANGGELLQQLQQQSQAGSSAGAPGSSSG